MRVIAAVTMFFLPATFTSVSQTTTNEITTDPLRQTFFSMTFFNFLDAERPQASRYIWIYVVVTIVLTVLIQTLWARMSKMEKAKILVNESAK